MDNNNNNNTNSEFLLRNAEYLENVVQLVENDNTIPLQTASQEAPKDGGQSATGLLSAKESIESSMVDQSFGLVTTRESTESNKQDQAFGLMESIESNKQYEAVGQKESTESNASFNFCRICHDSDSASEPLLSPCRCKGTLSLVHRSCLETWLAASDSSYCELCRARYVTIRTLKYPWRLASVASWLQSEEGRRDARELALDLVTFFVFTPMAVVCTYLGMFAAENYYLYELELRPGEMTSTRFVALLAVSMMATLDMAYLSWLMLRTHHHLYQWRSWWRRQCVVKLILPATQGQNSISNNNSRSGLQP